MTTKQILDSIYLIPVILDHLEDKNNKETTQNILDEFKITDKQLKELEKIKDLLCYHRDTIVSGFSGNYPLLRKGLKQYWNLYLSTFFNKLDMVGESNVFLDYACGDGQVGRKYKELNPLSKIIYVDRKAIDNSSPAVDFEHDPNWYIALFESVDIVLLSEVLHCKDDYWQNYLIKSSHSMLVPGGKLIVIENEDYCMEYRINKIKKSNVKVITKSTLVKLTEKLFKIKKRVKIQSHTAYVFTKI